MEHPEQPTPPPPPRDPRIRAMLASRAMGTLYLVVFVLIVVGQMALGDPDLPPVLQRFLPSHDLGLPREVAYGLAAGLAVFALQVVLRRVLPWIDQFDQVMHGLVGKPTLAQCFLLALTSSLAEEVFFRGILQVHTGLFLASVLFGLAHYVMWQWAVFAFLAGLLFGFLFDLTDYGLIAPVLAHFTINFLGLAQISRSCPEDAPPYDPASP